jgi:uncharacterized membrane protein
MISNTFAIILHLLGINIWIGGTFFSVVVLPRALASLPLEEQHRILRRILRQFFFWVWLAMGLVIASGGWMVVNVFGQLQSLPSYVIAMITIAVTMMVVFVWMYFRPYQRYRQCYQAEDLSACQRQLKRIRLMSKINMLLGISVLVVIGTGLYFMA